MAALIRLTTYEKKLRDPHLLLYSMFNLFLVARSCLALPGIVFQALQKIEGGREVILVTFKQLKSLSHIFSFSL